MNIVCSPNIFSALLSPHLHLLTLLRIPRADRRQATGPVEAEEKPECGGVLGPKSVSVVVANDYWIIMPHTSRELTSFSSKFF
jgi:hypothetical protein